MTHKNRNRIRRTLAAVVASSLALAGGTVVPATAKVTAKAVSLKDASVAPTEQRDLEPGKRVRLTCDGFRPSDVSAYRENGDALGAQVIARSASYWRDTYEGGRVKWTKATMQFFNDTERTVIVAIWCE